MYPVRPTGGNEFPVVNACKGDPGCCIIIIHYAQTHTHTLALEELSDNQRPNNNNYYYIIHRRGGGGGRSFCGGWWVGIVGRGFVQDYTRWVQRRTTSSRWVGERVEDLVHSPLFRRNNPDNALIPLRISFRTAEATGLWCLINSRASTADPSSSQHGRVDDHASCCDVARNVSSSSRVAVVSVILARFKRSSTFG